MGDNVFSIDSLDKLTRVLQDTILKRWYIPAITFTDDNLVYIISDNKAEFKVTDLGAEYRITIEKVK